MRISAESAREPGSRSLEASSRQVVPSSCTWLLPTAQILRNRSRYDIASGNTSSWHPCSSHTCKQMLSLQPVLFPLNYNGDFMYIHFKNLDWLWYTADGGNVLQLQPPKRNGSVGHWISNKKMEEYGFRLRVSKKYQEAHRPRPSRAKFSFIIRNSW